MKEIHDMCELENTSIFPIGDENSAFAQHFDGQSYLNMISTQQVMIGNVTFEAGCRNHWHIHHAKKGAVRFCQSLFREKKPRRSGAKQQMKMSTVNCKICRSSNRKDGKDGKEADSRKG